MMRLICAEFRKCWKTKKVIVAVLCFLCFMGCSYLFSMQRDNQAHQVESMKLGQENNVAGIMFSRLEADIQHTAKKDETVSLRTRFKLWKAASEACYDYSMVRQVPEFYGWDKISEAAFKRSKALEAVLTSKYYEGEFDRTELTVESVKNDYAYFTYLKENNLSMYSSIYQPTLCNFFIQIFQNETMVLLIIICAFFLVDLICQDFDYGSYKNIYITPRKRIQIMLAKIISSMCMNVLAFLIAFALFAVVPLSQHGFGSMIYPYILNQQTITFIPLFLQTMGLMLPVLAVYLFICVLGAIAFKNTTNTLLLMAGIIVFVYMCFKFFGTDLPILNWLPLFYFYPYEIISGAYSYPFIVCILLCLISLFILYVAFHKRIEMIDLKGSEAS